MCADSTRDVHETRGQGHLGPPDIALSSRLAADGGVKRVEEQFERPVRLRALQDLGAVEDDASLADPRLDREHAALEVLLSPRPAAVQWSRRIEPREGADAGGLRARSQLEDRTVVEEDVGPFRHPG